jgi:RNA polymerase sigma factor (sigma-70 family)
LELDPVTQQLPEPVCWVSPADHFGAQHDLDEVLEQLGPECQHIINLRHILGYHEKEIAELLQENESTVSSRLSRCRSRGREILNAG